MSRQKDQMRTALGRAGLLQGAAFESGKFQSPWYIRILLGLYGWLAALILITFLRLGYQPVFENSFLAFVSGAVILGGAFTILGSPKTEFGEQTGLALSLAGQLLVLFSVFKVLDGTIMHGLLFVAMLQSLLAMIMQHFMHRVLSALAAAVTFLLALTYSGLPYVGCGLVLFVASWCWLHEFRFPRQMRKIQGIGYGLILGLIPMKGAFLYNWQALGWHFGGSEPLDWATPWFGELLIGLVALYVVCTLLLRHKQRLSSGISLLTLAGMGLFCIVSGEVQGISLGLVIILLGFAGANRLLMAFGGLSLVFCLASYFYLLETGLLTKAMILLLAGLVLLLFRWLMASVLPLNKENWYVP